MLPMDTRFATTNRRTGVGCLALLGVPFAAVGVFMIFLTARALQSAYEVGHWSETTATIVDVELTTYRNKSATWEAKATYCYSVNGTTYKGTRVSVHGGADNLGSFQQSAYRELKRARDWLLQHLSW